MDTEDWYRELHRRNGWGGARKNSGPKKSGDRCPCGLMTKDRAAKRYHTCTKPKRKRKTNK